MVLLFTQQTLVQLDESRAALGLLLDQGKVLQTEPEFAATVSQAGGALELRWQSAYRRTKQESKRCRDIQDRRTRWDQLPNYVKRKNRIIAESWRLHWKVLMRGYDGILSKIL